MNKYAFHVYKKEEYKGTYIVSSDNLENVKKKLLNDDIDGFVYNGGFFQENYKPINKFDLMVI